MSTTGEIREANKPSRERSDQANFYRQSAEQSAVPVALTSGDAHLVRHANQAFGRFCDRTMETVVGTPLPTLLPGTGALTSLLERVSGTGMLDSASDSTMLGSNTTHFMIIATPLFDGRGRRMGIMVMFVDTTEQMTRETQHAKTAAQAVHANELLVMAGIREQELADTAIRQAAEMNGILENMNEGVTVIDSAGNVINNSVGRAMLGIETFNASLDDLRACDFFAPDGRSITFEEGAFGQALRGERFCEKEMILRCSDGTERRLLFSGSAVFDDQGNPELGINVFHDVTELRELERSREQYTSLITHDLRGPLSTARMAAQLLKTQPHRIELVERITRNIDRADQMVGDMLDAHRIEAREGMPLWLESCDVVKIIREVVEEMTSVHGDRFVMTGVEEVTGMWSPNEMRRAVWNLLSNAVKYGSPDSAVVVTVAKPRATWVEIAVQNFGPPIALEDQRRLFAPYARARPQASNGPRGWGLGLTLVRGCAEAHGGTVQVQSEGRAGTVFKMSLPINSSALPATR